MVVGGESEDNVIILNIGPSMNDIYYNKKNKITLVQEAIGIYLAQKLMFSPKDKIAILLQGSDETLNDLHEEHGGYEHIQIFYEFNPPSIELIQRFLTSKDGQGISTTNFIVPGFEALVVACDYLQRSSLVNKNAIKQIFIYTDDRASSSLIDDYDDYIKAFKDANIKPFVILFENKDDVKESPLTNFCNKTGGKVINYHEYLSQLQGVKKGQTRQTTKCRITLSITNKMEIPVWVYLKLKEETLPSLKSESTFSKAGGVRMERVYLKPDAEGETEVPYGSRTRAYLYGRDLVPIMEQEMVFLKYDGGNSGLKAIGCVPNDAIPFQFFMEKAEVVVGDPNSAIAQVAIQDLAKTLFEAELSLLVRYVWRARQIPKLAVLRPSRKCNCLYMCVIPYAEDIHNLILPSLPDVPVERSAIVGDFIDSMMLSSKEDPQYELYKPNATPNPTLLKFYDLVMKRAIYNEEKDESTWFAQLDNNPDTYILPNKDLLKKLENSTLLNNLKDCFPLEKVPSTTSSSKGSLRQAYIQKEEEMSRSSVKQELASIEINDMSIDSIRDEKEREQKITYAQKLTVGTISPVEDFEKMVSIKEIDLTPKAIDLMGHVIKDLLTEGGPSFFPKALKCLNALRTACIVEREPIRYNEIARGLKDLCISNLPIYMEFWKSLCEVQLGLIKQEEVDISNISIDDSIRFLNIDDKGTNINLENDKEQADTTALENEDLFSQLD